MFLPAPHRMITRIFTSLMGTFITPLTVTIEYSSAVLDTTAPVQVFPEKRVTVSILPYFRRISSFVLKTSARGAFIGGTRATVGTAFVRVPGVLLRGRCNGFHCRFNP